LSESQFVCTFVRWQTEDLPVNLILTNKAYGQQLLLKAQRSRPEAADNKPGVYILENTPPWGRGISADVIWGKKFEMAKRKRGKM
jgi:hypothetical protein